MRRVVILLLLVPLLLGAAPSAQSRAHRIEREIWSPFCPGQLLTECTTTQANVLRARILTRVRSGDSDAQIYTWLRDNYGEEVLAKPRASGAGLVVWLMPLGVLAIGALIGGRALRRWRRAPRATNTTESDLIRRVRDDVKKGL